MSIDTLVRAQYEEEGELAKLPGIRHGFFTRNGGVSEGIYATLNTGAGSHDDPKHVRENKERVAETIGVSPENLITLFQVHGDRVITVTAPFGGERPEADGLVTATPGLALGILTADCAPVLFADAKNRVIGACHSGWKGAFAGIALKTVEAMEALGAKRDRIHAAIGPCIGAESYEVDKSFYQRFLEQTPQNAPFFRVSKDRAGHYHFNLSGYVRATLQACGVKPVNVLAKDTCFHENDFFSFRRKTLRGEADYGRQISVITLLP